MSAAPIPIRAGYARRTHRFTQETDDWLEGLSKSHGISVNNLVGEILRRHIRGQFGANWQQTGSVLSHKIVPFPTQTRS